MIYYKIDVLETLKANGYSSYKIMKDKLIGMSSIQKIRENEVVSISTLDTICRLTNLQPADIIGYKDDNE